MAEFAAGARLLAIIVKRQSLDANSRSRLGHLAQKIDHGGVAQGPVLPSGRSQMARKWFSNWLVTQPSMVQCPELCTRGAISLATRRPLTTKNSMASTPM